MSLEFFGVDPRCTCEGVVSDALPHEQAVLLLEAELWTWIRVFWWNPDSPILKVRIRLRIQMFNLDLDQFIFRLFFLRSDSVHL